MELTNTFWSLTTKLLKTHLFELSSHHQQQIFSNDSLFFVRKLIFYVYSKYQIFLRYKYLEGYVSMN